MKTRDLGSLGEATLDAWCAQSGIVSNPVRRDRAGWDNLLEFPLEVPSSGPIDKTPTPISCRVQVKSTDIRRTQIKIKLTNWLRLVRDPGPSFVLVLEFDRTEVCQRAFLIHVGEHLIRRVLKRLRQLSREGQFEQLQRRTLSFAYGDTDELHTPSGRDLVAAIEHHVAPNMDAYAATKRRFLEEVGYEDTSAEINISFLIPETHKDRHPEELLVDFDIGLIKKMYVAEGAVWDTRFGIRDPGARGGARPRE